LIMGKTMKIKGSLTGIILIVAAVGLVLCGAVFAIATESCKTDASGRFSELIEYIEQQCIIYDEKNAEECTKSLFQIVDKAREIRKDLVFVKTSVEELLESQVEEKRLTGIIITDSLAGTRYSFCSDGRDADDWSHVINKFASVEDISFKTYSERIFEGTYCYDYAVVARQDTKGIILCYVRQDASVSSGSRLSINTLLTGYKFEKNGKIVVTDGVNVIAANDSGFADCAAAECPVVSELRTISGFGKLLTVSHGEYFAMRGKCRSYYIYVFMPGADVFTNRTTVALTSVMLYALFVCAFFSIRYVFLRNKRIEQQKNDEIYRKELDKLAEDAIRANEVKTEFLRRMSHDIRTPINGILGMVGIAEYYADDAEKQKECREKVRKAAGYLNDLVGDVLDMTKFDTGDFKWKDETFSLTELMNQTGELIDLQAREKGITLSVSGPEIVHDDLIGAAVQLKRIFVNLLGNAVKYNRENGSIGFSCRETDFDGQRASYEFTVSDTGTGIGEDFQKIMYEPFSQEKTDDASSGGAGLGLSIVKKIVDGMGGTISVTSEKGKGTVFTLRLSFDTAGQPEKREDVSEPERKALAGYRILVAEDNELNLEIAVFILKTAGAEVITAVNGLEAADIFKKSAVGSIDAVLMDVMMPVCDGIQAVHIIRSADRKDAEYIPIIAMTANAFSDDVVRVRQAGMNYHLAKPIDRSELIRVVAESVKNRGDRKK